MSRPRKLAADVVSSGEAWPPPMAAYARWSAYISGTGIVLTLAGLWFIKRTLEISQKQ